MRGKVQAYKGGQELPPSLFKNIPLTKSFPEKKSPVHGSCANQCIGIYWYIDWYIDRGKVCPSLLSRGTIHHCGQQLSCSQRSVPLIKVEPLTYRDLFNFFSSKLCLCWPLLYCIEPYKYFAGFLNLKPIEILSFATKNALNSLLHGIWLLLMQPIGFF